jgi:Ca-activated chloride channel homolog
LRDASPRSRGRLARLCLWLAVSSLVVAAARPSIEIDPPRRPGILELVVDTSGSTAAGDIAPTRFAAIQEVTTGLLDRIPADLRGAWSPSPPRRPRWPAPSPTAT